jgi:hypothetical protein
MSDPAGKFDAPRNYLFVSSREPLAAAEALSNWADGPPDLCITSPSREAHDTAAFACAGHFVRTIEEPMLARRGSHESVDNFADRFAEALLIVLTYDARAALVVCDELPAKWATPLFADDESLQRRADRLERELPLP